MNDVYFGSVAPAKSGSNVILVLIIVEHNEHWGCMIFNDSSPSVVLCWNHLDPVG